MATEPQYIHLILILHLLHGLQKIQRYLKSVFSHYNPQSRHHIIYSNHEQQIQVIEEYVSNLSIHVFFIFYTILLVIKIKIPCQSNELWMSNIRAKLITDLFTVLGNVPQII